MHILKMFIGATVYIACGYDIGSRIHESDFFQEVVIPSRDRVLYIVGLQGDPNRKEMIYTNKISPIKLQ